MKIIFFIVILCAVIPGYSQTVSFSPARPFAEYEKTKFVFFDSGFSFESLVHKKTIAKFLPRDVTLIVIISPYNNKTQESVEREFEGLIPKENLKIVKANTPGVSFWTRDYMPVPTITETQTPRLVDAKYYHKFEPDVLFAKYFGIEVISHGQYFEGGNFVANRLGTCITVNHQSMGKPPPSDAIFKTYYGCTRIYRMPKLKGIGHIDESVKFISDNVIITDLPAYKTILEKAGFTVHLLPQTPGSYRTYINSLIVNGTVFVPTYNVPEDQVVLDTYKSLGLNAIPMDSRLLSDNGKGGIHCITMSYPQMNLEALLQILSFN